VSASDKTSAAAKPIRPTSSPADKAKAIGKAGIGESAYLVRQQQLARQAMTRAVGDLLSFGKQAADPGKVMASHPWVTLGASAAAGFAAAAVAVPSKEQQALRKLAKIEQALNLHPPERHRPNGKSGPANGAPTDEFDVSGKSGEQAYKSGRSSLMRAVLGELVGALKPAIVSLLTAGVTGAVAKPSQEEMQAAAGAQDPAQQYS